MHRDKPENKKPDNGESLQDLLSKRLELDHKLESKYAKVLTVMFTDIKGSTEFYDTHGDINGRIMQERHNQILHPIIDIHNGKIIKSIGDGMLLVFENPREGVQAAIDMQRKLKEFNEHKRHQEKIKIRISLNHGKVIDDRGDVYGRDVSVAARINDLTEANQILITEEVYEKVRGSGEIRCHSIPPAKVKGITDTLQLFRIIWDTHELLKGDRNDSAGHHAHDSGMTNVFVIEVTREGEKVKICGYEKFGSEQKTVRHYEEVKVDYNKLIDGNADVINLLNRASQKGHIGRDILDKLKTTGQLLYDHLFSLELKHKLSVTESEYLILSIDDNLVNIPWELLHDGTSFLCLRFNMGRIVQTRQNISSLSPRRIETPLKILILSDPQGNLTSAYKEGYAIRDNLESKENEVNADIRSSDISSKYFMGEIRNYDIVHYAGHADYNKENPSDSGFLLKDGKLYSSDIINMMGSKPFPSLIFSNACQSGQTDMWKVNSDFGNDIYGIANAFLLAGIRHYIGTFWNIPDESGLYFAVEFYNELMSGSTIGEAVRKARLQLIDRYGEDTVIWASYMLYGDPTFRYMEFQTPPEEEKKQKRAYGRERSVGAGKVRAGEDVVVFPSRNNKWIVTGSLLILIIAVLIVFAVIRSGKKDQLLLKPSEGEQLSEESSKAKEQRIDELVASLIENYNNNLNRGTTDNTVHAAYSPPTLVFLDIKAHGITEPEKEYIFLKMIDELQNSRRVKVVEREILDKLLEELKLTSSQLADPATALKVGRILSAQLISTGTILREGKEWQASLRFIETETTSIRSALTETMEAKIKDEFAVPLSHEIIQRMKEAYPLHAEIINLREDNVVINIGEKHGLKVGQKMRVAAEGGGMKPPVGDIEIISVEANTSHATVITGHGDMKEGLKVEEIL